MKLDPENYADYVGYRIKLNPTEDQKKIFIKYFGISRFVYNWAKDIYEEEYFNNDEELSFNSLNYEFTKFKNKDENKSMFENIDVGSLKLSLKDLYNAYKKYHIGKTEVPKYRSKKKSSKQFPVRDERLSIYEDNIRLPSIGFVEYSNSYGDKIIGTGYKQRLDKSLKYLKYTSVRVNFDGNNYWLTFSLPKDQEHNVSSYTKYAGNIEWQKQERCEAIGIDVGLRNEKWMVDSTGYILERPDSSKYYKKLNLLENKLRRQYVTNINREPRLFKDRKAPINGQSKNMQKTKAKINKYYKKITNRRRNTVYNYCNRLLDLKPKAIVMEDISVSRSMIIPKTEDVCNKERQRFNALVSDAALYDSMKIIERTMVSNGIDIIYADSNYPSSQICSCCGYQQNIGRKKIYRCPNCGLVINRDYNAALNLASLAYKES